MSKVLLHIGTALARSRSSRDNRSPAKRVGSSGQAALMAPALSTLLHSGAFQSALAPIGGIAHRTGRQTVAEFLARGSWDATPGSYPLRRQWPGRRSSRAGGSRFDR